MAEGCWAVVLMAGEAPQLGVFQMLRAAWGDLLPRLAFTARD